MEVKKSDKASLKGMGAIYLLTGITLVLALVWGLLQYQKELKKEVKRVQAEAVYVPDAIVVDIPEEVAPPPPPPPDQPPPPPPPPIPEEIEVVDDTEELPDPDPEPIEIAKPQVITGPAIPQPTTKKPAALPAKKIEKKEKRETVKRVTARQVTKMAVYPGCERDAKKGKKALIDCFQKKISADIGDELYDFSEIAQDEDIEQALSKLRFVVGVDGYIKEVKAAAGGNDATKVLNPEAVKALERVSAYLKRKGKLIQPAELNDGEKVELDFAIPVRFVLQ